MSAYEKVANMIPHKIPGNHSGALHERRPQDDDGRRAHSVRKHRLREIRNKCPLFREVPQPGSYRLRRHFPRLCNFSTRAGHPYRPSILRRSKNGGSVSDRHRLCTFRMQRPSFDGIRSERTRSSCSDDSSHISGLFFPPGRFHPPPWYRAPRCCPPGNKGYQLAFVTPGIRPLEAISRNWIRLMPNRRM